MTGQLFLASREQDDCTRWKQYLRTLRRLDDNNVAVIYCGCSRNSEFGMTGWQWKDAIKVNSEVGGKVCVVNVSGVLRFPVWPTGIVLLYDGFLALHCSILTCSAKCFLCCLRPLVASHWFVSLTVSSDFSFVSGKLRHLSFCRGPFLP